MPLGIPAQKPRLAIGSVWLPLSTSMPPSGMTIGSVARIVDRRRA
jgi:hypothetical protein